MESIIKKWEGFEVGETYEWKNDREVKGAFVGIDSDGYPIFELSVGCCGVPRGEMTRLPKGYRRKLSNKYWNFEGLEKQFKRK